MSSNEVESELPAAMYALIQVLQQKADEAVRFRTYAGDARCAGDGELAGWFEELAAADDLVVLRAQALVRQRNGRSA